MSGCSVILSFGEVESASGSIVVSRSLAAERKSRTVGAIDLSSNASSSGAALETGGGFSPLAIILFFTSSLGIFESEHRADFAATSARC
jgi:hypothetical protein